MRTEVIKYTSVKGKVLYYIKFIRGSDEHIINVGEGTYHKVKALQDGENTSEADGEHPGVQLDNIPKRKRNVLDNKSTKRGRGNRGGNK